MASVNIIQSCTDISDIIPLYPQHGLYLKPIAKLNISVHLPTLKLPGKTISNWEVMEKLKYWTIPDEFTSIIVSKNTLEFIRFEAEIESRSKIPAVLARLDGRSIKISGFTESLKVRAAEAKCDYPTRHHWDSFFRDAKNMNEMKPGERPDTIHITNLPCKWFASQSVPEKPSEYILRKVFETFGEVRNVDIPLIDPYRSRMKAHISGIKMFSYHQNIVFECYLQFKEYICFMKAMDTLRGMKLIHKEDTKVFSASISVDFDKTKHLTETSIKKRRNEREKFMSEEREHEEQERLKKEKEEAEIETERKQKIREKEEKLKRRKMREEKRKLKQLEKLKAKEAEDMNRKIASEERLLVMAQRRLESIRLLSELFKRLEEAAVKKLKEKDTEKRSKKEKGNLKGKEANLRTLKKNEEELRRKLIEKLKSGDKKCNDGESQPGSSKFSNAATVSGTVPVSPSSHEDVTSLITSSESEMSIDKENIDGKDISNKKTQPLPDNLRGGRGVGSSWYSRSHDAGMGYNPYHTGGFSRHPHRGYFPRGRRGYRWNYPNMRGRGYFPPPYIDPLLLDINHQYYKYFHKLTRSRSSRSSSKHSRSRSRSSSRSSYYNRRYSRSRTRSNTRSSYSRSRSRSRSYSRKRSGRSLSKESRSRSRSKKSRSSKRSKSRSSHGSRSGNKVQRPSKHSRSRSRSYSKDKRRNNVDSEKHNRHQTRSSGHSKSENGNQNKRKSRWDTAESNDKSEVANEESRVDAPIKSGTKELSSDNIVVKSMSSTGSKDNVDDIKNRKSPVRFPSPTHTWSRSPSRTRSLSWEKNERKNKNSSKDKIVQDNDYKKESTKNREHRKHKKKKKSKVKSI